MGILEIHLLGMLQIRHGGLTAPNPIHAVQALLAYLVLHRKKTHAREVLGGLFWGDHLESQARSCLSTALWRLRQVLEPNGVARGAYLLTLRSGEVGFNCDSDHWLDVAAFEEGVQPLVRHKSETRAPSEWAGGEKAISYYGGDLLEGFYEDWALRERERLRLLYLDGLARLLEHYSDGEAIDQALECGRRILELDPLREEIHREMMRLHLRNGHRALAIMQYENCRNILAQELGIEPMEETQALHHEIAPDARGEHWRRPPPGVLQRVLPPLRNAALSIDEARNQLNRAIRLAESEMDDPTQ